MTFWEHYGRQVDRNPDHTAIIDQQGSVLSHRDLLSLSERSAMALSGFGVGRGELIGVFLPNRAMWPILAMASARSGIGLLGLNTRFRHAELNHLLAVAEIDVVVAPETFLGIDAPGLMAELDHPPRVIIDGAGRSATSERAVPWRDLLSKIASGPDDTNGLDLPFGGSDDPMMGFTTSGTTGFPKIAMHDQAQTYSHLLAVIDAFSLSSDSVTLAPLPLCGAFGYTAAMATLLGGGTIVANETWDPDAAAMAIAEHGVTFCSGSDDMLIDLAASEHFAAETTWTDGGFADFTNAGPEAVAAIDRVGGGTTRLTGLYGSSEGFALMSSWSRDAPYQERARNGGYLVGADMAVKCCDPETGSDLPEGEAGELWFKGPNLIDRYLNNPDASASAFTEDGWYRSGDLGHTIASDHRGHQGFIFLARLGDTLRLRGFLCDPAEIEKHLETHEAVDLAQVVGVSKPEVGDVAVAFVRRPKQIASQPVETSLEETLLQHCKDGLANYKRPARIVVVDEFPVTDGPNGIKIRKVELRDRAAALLAGPQQE